MRTVLLSLRGWLLVGAICVCFFAQAQVSNDIINGFGNGNIASVKKYLNDNVELVIQQNDNIYSKEQSSVIINDFFRKNTPISCQLVHQGNRDNAEFVICNLHTRQGNFRVYFLIKNNLIYQLRIENSNE